MKKNGLRNPASSVKYFVTASRCMSGVGEEVIDDTTKAISRAGSCMMVVRAKRSSAHVSKTKFRKAETAGDVIMDEYYL